MDCVPVEVEKVMRSAAGFAMKEKPKVLPRVQKA